MPVPQPFACASRADADAMAEEEGVEPTGDAWRLPPELKSGHPTGNVSLPALI